MGKFCSYLIQQVFDFGRDMDTCETDEKEARPIYLITRQTWLSRKLNRRPVRPFKLPKLIPQRGEGISRLLAFNPWVIRIPLFSDYIILRKICFLSFSSK